MKIGILQCDSTNVNFRDEHGNYPEMFMSLFKSVDPDLEFNINLPKNFIQILLNLSDKFECHKIGFALNINDFDQMYGSIYYNDLSIYDWEKQFWDKKMKMKI